MFHNGESSDLKLITCGVTQGSVLGLLLFLIYINHLPNISNKLIFLLFADDTNIYFESDDLLKVEKTVNEELKKLNLWLNINSPSLNISKINFIIFDPSILLKIETTIYCVVMVGKVNTTSKEQSHSSLKLIYWRL